MEGMSVVGEVERSGHSVVKAHVVVVKRVWELLVVRTPVVETVVEVHESCQSTPKFEGCFQA